VIAFEPPHVSAYALTVEPATPLGRRVAAGVTSAPDPDGQAAKYELVDDRLEAAGLSWYEVSNWAGPGHECRHNQLYWRQGEYLAVGCAGHGHLDGIRWWNVRTPERYVKAIMSGRSPEAGRERLPDAARAEERCALALRTAAGANVPATAAGVAGELRAAGLLEPAGSDPLRVVLTRRGRLLADDVTARLLLADGDRGPVGTR
jgi:coproporphyrinogen III oxidase-like Fe-S oxidoreductase